MIINIHIINIVYLQIFNKNQNIRKKIHQIRAERFYK